MKTSHAVAALLPVVLALFAGLAFASIEGSKHDFSNEAWSGGDKCGACHTPHKSEDPKVAPLWEPDADLSRRFGTDVAGTSLPGSGTTSCLRCHDGTIAEDVTGSAAKSRLLNKQHPGLFATGHGTSNHPVGVKYPQFDRGYAAQTSVIGKGVPLPDGRVECISCHDPHNDAEQKHMLVKSNERSDLCLTCHRK